jgi:hypothetical protein
MLTERRRVQAEYRAGKRFIAMFTEKYPLLGRVAYLAKGDDKKISIRVLFTSNKQEKEIAEFAVLVGGLIAQQEGVEVLLTPEVELNAPEIKTDEQMKVAQQNISYFVQVLCKLKDLNDKEAKKQREAYLARLRNYYNSQLNYLLIS